MRGFDESNLHPGDTIAVMGLGPIGLMFVRLAKYAYGANVIAIARRIEQVDRAKRLGADEGILIGDRQESADRTEAITPAAAAPMW